MALQYDTPVSSTEFAASITANTNISSTTNAAITTVLGLNTTESLVVAGWNGVGAVIAPVGQVPDVLNINIAGTAPTTLDLPTGTEDTKVIVINSNADVTLTLGEEAASSARLLATDAVVQGLDRIVIGGAGNDTLTYNGSANVLLEGGAGNDNLVTGSGNDVIVAGTGTNTIDAGAGNDTIVTGLGIDTIAAGTGFDTIDVVGNRADFTASVANGALVLTGAGASTGAVSTVTGAEFVTFADGKTLTIVDSQAEAQVLSLYSAVLGRDVDAGGAANFISEVENGTSLESIVNTFLTSAEHYSSLRADFLTDVYSSLLGRASDSEGVASWQAVFEAGATRGEVIAGIAGSEEAAGLSDADFVSALYTAALGRDAEEAGLNNWVSLLASGTSRTEVADSIYSSGESNTKINTEFVDSLFDNLGSTNDAAKAGYLLALESGASHTDVVVSLVGQPDALDNVTNVIVVPGAV